MNTQREIDCAFRILTMNAPPAFDNYGKQSLWGGASICICWRLSTASKRASASWYSMLVGVMLMQSVHALLWNLKASTIYTSATHFFGGMANQAFTEELFENITHGRNG